MSQIYPHRSTSSPVHRSAPAQKTKPLGGGSLVAKKVSHCRTLEKDLLGLASSLKLSAREAPRIAPQLNQTPSPTSPPVTLEPPKRSSTKQSKPMRPSSARPAVQSSSPFTLADTDRRSTEEPVVASIFEVNGVTYSRAGTLQEQAEKSVGSDAPLPDGAVAVADSNRRLHADQQGWRPEHEEQRSRDASLRKWVARQHGSGDADDLADQLCEEVEPDPFSADVVYGMYAHTDSNPSLYPPCLSTTMPNTDSNTSLYPPCLSTTKRGRPSRTQMDVLPLPGPQGARLCPRVPLE